MAFSKGVAQIISAWLALEKRLGESCPPLWLVGGEPEEIERIREAIHDPAFHRSETSGRIIWWGYLDDAGIAAVLLKAYVLVTHSQYEPGGRVILEAMAQGVPVIATAHGFALDLIEDWHGGFIVDYGDVESLARRMSHFAQQPLLRHAMGAAARRSARSALNGWNFMETHMRLYDLAVEHKGRRPLPDPSLIGSRQRTVTTAGSAPLRGFDGVYPFEGELVHDRDVEEFASRALGIEPDEVQPLPPCSRSRLWTVCSGEREWIVKHVPTVYAVRPIWDRGFSGPSVDRRDDRVSGEILGAACFGGAPITAIDPNRGLILRPSMNLADFRSAHYDGCIAALKAFHLSTPENGYVGQVRKHIDHDWRDVSDEDVFGDFTSLERGFRENRQPFHAWRPMSLRMCWRWLGLGLRTGWLEVPDEIRPFILSRLDEESAIAAREEPFASFGWSHGDVAPDHFRVTDSGSIVMIDCERMHPGFFGHDPARFALGLADRSDDDETAYRLLERTLNAIPPSMCSRRLLWSWILWVMTIDSCRSYVLLEAPAMARDRARFRMLLRCETLTDGPAVNL